MNVASHVEKIEKLEALRAKLDPMEDFELWFWALMNAGTNAVNAALHQAGVTRADDVFPTQPGVYVDRDGKAGFHPLGDVLHVGRPKVEAAVPADIQQMMDKMEIIEHHRDPCIRGEREPTKAIAQECAAALSVVLKLFNERIGGK
jgi:hypothetical protein